MGDSPRQPLLPAGRKLQQQALHVVLRSLGRRNWQTTSPTPRKWRRWGVPVYGVPLLLPPLLLMVADVAVGIALGVSAML